jgi:hypothetical protein
MLPWRWCEYAHGGKEWRLVFSWHHFHNYITATVAVLHAKFVVGNLACV